MRQTINRFTSRNDCVALTHVDEYESIFNAGTVIAPLDPGTLRPMCYSVGFIYFLVFRPIYVSYLVRDIMLRVTMTIVIGELFKAAVEIL